ncbi:hypothetical protein SELMODRAFT_416226 [Selaginella moellendorffii]|uniref:Uncharacterized protein n=1 Tax=Selaginella moellendorffii TaxID=88036 RepID=D8RYH3_SELML|nr:hypothetical protein SELMODRAFT_416226 [Selaginella moellendorffii]
MVAQLRRKLLDESVILGQVLDNVQWQYSALYGVVDVALCRLEHRIQRVWSNACNQANVSEYAATKAIVRERPSYLSDDNLCYYANKRRPTSIEAVQEELQQQQQQEMPLLSSPLIKYIRAKPSIPREIRGRGPGSRKFRQELVSWVERDLFGGVGSLDMQARLVFDERMLAHEWQALFGFRYCKYEQPVDKDLSTPDVVFDETCGSFDHEKYDELVEHLEAGKIIAVCGGFNKLSAWPGNACVDLFNFQVGAWRSSSSGTQALDLWDSGNVDPAKTSRTFAGDVIVTAWLSQTDRWIAINRQGSGTTIYPANHHATFDHPKRDELTGLSIDVVRRRSELLGVYAEGGRTFLLSDVGPQGCIPYFLTNFPVLQALSNLRNQLPDSTIIYINTYDIKYSLTPSKNIAGFQFANKACCGIGGNYNYNFAVQCGQSKVMAGKTVVSTTCKNPSAYLNWDGVHNTKAANRIIMRELL